MKTDNLLYSSYLIIRKSIGYLAVSLPFILIVGGLLLNGGRIEISLSAYYHNNLGDIFVLAMGAAGMLLIAYRGSEKIIRGLTTLGGLLALCIVLFPTETDGAPGPYGVFRLSPPVSGKIHLFCAVSFFAVLGIISFWRFTRHRDESPAERKKHDRWYRLLGLVSLICAVLYLVIALFFKGALRFYPVLAAETVGLEAAGLTWLIKGARTLC